MAETVIDAIRMTEPVRHQYAFRSCGIVHGPCPTMKIPVSLRWTEQGDGFAIATIDDDKYFADSEDEHYERVTSQPPC